MSQVGFNAGTAAEVDILRREGTSCTRSWHLQDGSRLALCCIACSKGRGSKALPAATYTEPLCVAAAALAEAPSLFRITQLHRSKHGAPYYVFGEIQSMGRGLQDIPDMERDHLF